ncbi:unnamed protein product [[Candida] boidinii]|nr:unnamed protein product [[Candida] boidinii]
MQSSSKSGVQKRYSDTPKKILNNGVEQIIWSYGTIPNSHHESTIANNDKCEFCWNPLGGILDNEYCCRISSSNNNL